MQFRDLKKQYCHLKTEIDAAIHQVIEECDFISGIQVDKLESELEEYIGVKHCISCANGTDALSLTMLALKIGQGDAVFVPDFTFFSSGEIVSLAGAMPIFVDVEKDGFNIDPNSLEVQIKRTLKEGRYTPKAIIAVDLFGQPADFYKIQRIADKYQLKVIEDGAQGFGGQINNKKACSFGDISTTSFFPAKPLGCYGDGGAIFTNNSEYAEQIKSLRVHGKGLSKYDNVRIGMNSRLDTIQAAILSVKLKAFKTYELDAVNQVAKHYAERLRDIVTVPFVPHDFYSSWAQYTIRLENRQHRDSMQQSLKKNGIPAMIYYRKPMHKQEAFNTEAYDDSDFQCSNELCETVLSLPIHPYISEEEVEKICNVIKESLPS